MVSRGTRDAFRLDQGPHGATRDRRTTIQQTKTRSPHAFLHIVVRLTRYKVRVSHKTQSASRGR